MRRPLLAVTLSLPLSAFAVTDLSIATAASGNSSGACAVTGDGQSRVVLRCVGQPEFEAQVQTAVGTIPPTSAINLDEEVSTPGYEGSTRGARDIALSHIVFTPKPSAALARAAKLEVQLKEAKEQAGKANGLEREIADLRSQLDAARSLQLQQGQAPSRLASKVVPGNGGAPPLPGDFGVGGTGSGAHRGAPPEQGAASGPSTRELEQQIGVLRAELAAIRDRGNQSSAAIPLSATASGVNGRASMPYQEPYVALPKAPIAPERYYALLAFKDARRDGAHYIKGPSGQQTLVMGPYDEMSSIYRTLALVGIYPTGLISTRELPPQ